MKQRWIPIILILAAFAGLAGCGSSNSPTGSNTSPSSPTYTYGLSTFFGTTGSTPMNGPMGIGVSGSTVWVANAVGNNFQPWTTGGSLITTITTDIAAPYSVSVGPDGYVYVANNASSKVSEYSPLGTFITVFGHAQLSGSGAYGVAVGSTYAYASGSGIIFGYPISGTDAGKTFGSPISFGYSGAGQLQLAFQISLDGNGNVYAADYMNGRVVKYNPAGTYQMAVTLASAGTPTGVAVDNSGNIFALDDTNKVIVEFNSGGTPVTTIGQGDLTGVDSGAAQLAIGADGTLYATDTGNNQVVIFTRQ